MNNDISKNTEINILQTAYSMLEKSHYSTFGAGRTYKATSSKHQDT